MRLLQVMCECGCLLVITMVSYWAMHAHKPRSMHRCHVTFLSTISQHFRCHKGSMQSIDPAAFCSNSCRNLSPHAGSLAWSGSWTLPGQEASSQWGCFLDKDLALAVLIPVSVPGNYLIEVVAGGCAVGE